MLNSFLDLKQPYSSKLHYFKDKLLQLKDPVLKKKKHTYNNIKNLKFFSDQRHPDQYIKMP